MVFQMIRQHSTVGYLKLFNLSLVKMWDIFIKIRELKKETAVLPV